LATWTRIFTWEQVAVLFHPLWATVAAAVEEAVSNGLAHRHLSAATYIGIDESPRKRGHVCVTNVYNLNTWALLERRGPGAVHSGSILRLPR
jgi:hypothetical protein